MPGVTYTYQWAYVVPYTFTNVLVGETNAALTRSNVTFSNAGAYVLTLTASACGQSIFTNLGIISAKVIPPILNARTLPNGSFEFTYEYPGPNAPFFSVRASSDPTLLPYFWYYAGTATAVGGGLYRFTDSLATNHARRFYRLE